MKQNHIIPRLITIIILTITGVSGMGIGAERARGKNAVHNLFTAFAQSTEKVAILDSGPMAGHYLEWNGQPIFLIGDSVTQGWMETGTNFNQAAYIDALASNGINLLMIWSYIGTSAAGQQDDSRIGYDAPEIWPWEGSPDNSSFDLTNLNQAYFDRLKQLVGYAESKGIVVLITIHDGWAKGNFDEHPFNAALGNGPLTDKMQYVELADYDHEMPAAFDPSWNRSEKNQYFQERLCAKFIQELSPYSNVIYEMFNEGNKYNQTDRNKHEQHFLAFFRAHCDNLLLTNTDHIVGDDPHHDAKVDVVTLHGDWTHRFNDFQSGFNQSPPKTYLQSEPVPGWDGSNVSLDEIRNGVWEVAVAGAGWVNQNDLSFGWDPNSAIASKSSLRDQAYEIAGNAARFFNNPEVEFWNMRPKGSLSSTGVAMAQEGIEYVIYAPSGGNFSVDLTAADSGTTFIVEWYDPQTGDFTPAGQTQGGSIPSFSAPDSNDWVLHIKRDGQAPTPTPSPTPSPTPTPDQWELILNEQLNSPPTYDHTNDGRGTFVNGGSFTTEGWKTTSNSDYIEFHLPTTTKGWVEFDVKGWDRDTEVFNDDGPKYSFFGMWDDSLPGQWGRPNNIKFNPYKAIMRVYGPKRNDDGALDWGFYSLLKLRLNVQAFTDGGEDDPNAFECYANPDSYPSGNCEAQGIRHLFSWHRDRTYHFKLEWGDGGMRWYLYGDEDEDNFGEITYYDYGYIGQDAYDPVDHALRIGTAADWPAPIGTIISNLKVYSGDSGLLPNRPPVAYDDAITTTVTKSISGTLSASDPDMDPLTFSIVSNGALGTVVITNPNTGEFSYTPNSTGTDHFTFKANDGELDSNEATVEVTIQPESNPRDPVQISDISVGSNKSYIVGENGLQDGEIVYIDRAFTYSDVPEFLLGAAYIRTANDDKESQGNEFLSFKVDREVTVYIARDDRYQMKPDWMAGFEDTGEGIHTDRPFSLFKRNFPAGEIVLGGNAHPSEITNYSMYTVIIVSTGAQSPTFVDVPFDHPYYNCIEFLYQAGYTAGCSVDPLMYCPATILKREDASVFVIRGYKGVDFFPPQPTTQIFDDVPLSRWSVDWITQLWNDKYTAGCSTSPLNYCPARDNSLAEGLVFFLRMMNGPEYVPPDPVGIFDDAQPGEWFTPWVEAGYNAGLIKPCQITPEFLICPNEPLTRAKAAYIMYQAKNAEPSDPAILGKEIYIGNGNSPDIAVDSVGNLHIVYDADPGGITYVHVTPEGMSSPLEIYPGARPRVAIDNQDNPHIVYIINNVVYYTKMQAGSFISPIVVYEFPDRTEKLRIAVDKRDNRAFIMYEHVGEKEGNDPETAWVFYYHVVDNSGAAPFVGPRIHPPTSRTSEYVEQSGGVVYDSQGTAHYTWRDWGGQGGERGLHYQTLSINGQYSEDLTVYGGISDFIDITLDDRDNVLLASTTAWALDGILYATYKGGSWTTDTHFAELYPTDVNDDNLFDPDHNVPAIAYDRHQGLAYIVFSAGETEIHHSYENIKSYFCYVDENGNFSNAYLLHDPERGSGGKYNGVRLAPAAKKGVFTVIPRLRAGYSNNWEIILRSIGGAEVGPP